MTGPSGFDGGAASGSDQAFPHLDADALTELATYGQVRRVAAGDVLYRAGDGSYNFFVVLEGRVTIVRSGEDGDVEVVSHDAGRFLGELNLLTGQRPYLTARVTEPGRVLEITQPEFRRLMSQQPALADLIFRALVARREILRSGEGARAIEIVGSRYSSEAMALRAFANRAQLPHTWIDVEDVPDLD